MEISAQITKYNIVDRSIEIISNYCEERGNQVATF